MDTKAQHKTLGIYIATGTGLSTCLGLILATVYQDLLPFIGVFIGIGAAIGVAMGIAIQNGKEK